MLQFLKDVHDNLADASSRLAHKDGGFRTKVEEEGPDYVQGLLTAAEAIRSDAKRMLEDSVLPSVLRHAKKREEDAKDANASKKAA